MIPVDVLDASDLGRAVVYVGKKGLERETGTVAGWGRDYVYVKYPGRPSPVATNPKLLVWKDLNVKKEQSDA